MKKCGLLMLAAGAAFSTVAMAQDMVYVPQISAHHMVSPVGSPGHDTGYGQRDILPIYDTLTGGGFYLGNCAHMIDDVGFANGPWSRGTMPQLITQMTYSVYIQNTDVLDEQNLVIFWRKSDVNFQGFGGAGTNMIRPGATPLAVVRVDVPAGPPTLGTDITVDLTGLPGGGVLIPSGDDGFYVDVSWVTHGYTPSPTATSGGQPDWSNLTSNASGNLWGGRDPDTLLPYDACPYPDSDRSVLFGNKSNAPNGGNPAVPGFSLRDYGRDIARNDGSYSAMCGNIGQFIGNGGPAVSGGAVEHRYIAADSDANAYRCQFQGNVVVTPPANPTDLSCIPDTGTTVNSSVATGGVKWYTLCLNGDIKDAFNQFADFDTEGSAADVDIALYGSNGAVIAIDRNDGSGNNAQLSFGVGIRAAVGDGEQYNGRDGEFLAGNFYLGVAPAGSQFNFGFDVTSAGTGGNFRLNCKTNCNNGAIAPSVAPAGMDLGDVSNGATTGPVDLPGKSVKWFKFTTNFNTATTADRYLDIKFTGDGGTISDTEAFVFDSNGLMVATNDDDGGTGGGTLSQFSFGTAYPTPRPSPGTRNFAGQDGDLAAGTYYLGVGIWDVLTLAGNDRWHLRATNVTGATLSLIFDTGATPACAPCAADFNQDGGVDGSDIEAFFGSWSAGDSCGDVNQDGGVDGSDIEAFFTVWQAGGC